MKKSIVIILSALVLCGCASIPDTDKNMIFGASCKNWLVEPAPTISAALTALNFAAHGRNYKTPVCKTTEAAGISDHCGMYWSQILCEAELND